MKITITSNYGNFATRLSAEVPDQSNATLCKEGLANILYRVCGSGVDKEFKLKKGDKRNGIPYSDVNAVKVVDAVETKIAELMDEPDPEGQDYSAMQLEFEVTGKHEFGEAGSAMVRATALVDSFLSDAKTEAAYRQVFDMQGMEDAMTATRDELIEFAHSKGLGIQVKKS